MKYYFLYGIGNFGPKDQGTLSTSKDKCEGSIVNGAINSYFQGKCSRPGALKEPSGLGSTDKRIFLLCLKTPDLFVLCLANDCDNQFRFPIIWAYSPRHDRHNNTSLNFPTRREK